LDLLGAVGTLESGAPARDAVAAILEKLPAGFDFDAILSESPYAEWYWNSISNPGSSSAKHHAQSWQGRSYETFAEDFERASADWSPEV
jgi:hypothetical protein